jgi:hypothetical protein
MGREVTSVPLFRRPTRKAAELAEAQKSQQRAENLLAFVVDQRDRVDSIVKALGDRSHLNNFGDEVSISFTPRRFPDARTSPRPRPQ